MTQLQDHTDVKGDATNIHQKVLSIKMQVQFHFIINSIAILDAAGPKATTSLGP